MEIAREAFALCPKSPEFSTGRAITSPSAQHVRRAGRADSSRHNDQVKGDQHCATVATAAVIAKVTRDRLMVDLAQSNPRYAAYEWAHNKGYGSAAHRTAIAEHGPTPLHRVSWHLT